MRKIISIVTFLSLVVLATLLFTSHIESTHYLKVHSNKSPTDQFFNLLENGLDYDHHNPHGEPEQNKGQSNCAKKEIKQCALALKQWILHEPETDRPAIVARLNYQLNEFKQFMQSVNSTTTEEQADQFFQDNLTNDPDTGNFWTCVKASLNACAEEEHEQDEAAHHEDDHHHPVQHHVDNHHEVTHHEHDVHHEHHVHHETHHTNAHHEDAHHHQETEPHDVHHQNNAHHETHHHDDTHEDVHHQTHHEEPHDDVHPQVVHHVDDTHHVADTHPHVQNLPWVNDQDEHVAHDVHQDDHHVQDSHHNTHAHHHTHHQTVDTHHPEDETNAHENVAH